MINSPVVSFPSQMVPYRDKIRNKKEWAKQCVDTCEKLGRKQYLDNLRFSENYRMLNGEFIAHHYFEQEGYKDWLSALTAEFDIPSTLRHYDIIGKVINNLTEKLTEFPDVFRVEELFEEDETNEYIRTQSRLMHDSIKADINKEIESLLVEQGVDLTKKDFASEDEAMQYYKEVQQMAQALTPPQIQKYMNTEWQSQGEIWATHQLEVDKQRYKLHELERKEFKDMLITDRCFRHFYLTGEGYMQETWNPINTFFHTSPDIDWVEDGDYVGRIIFMSRAEVIERYAWKLNSKDLKTLESLNDDNDTNNRDLSGFPYNVYAPFEDFKSYTQISENTGYDPISKLPIMNDGNLMALTTNAKLPYMEGGMGLYRVSEVYWKSQKKIGKVVYIDPYTGILAKDIVNENFVAPEGFKEKKGDYFAGSELNTVYWTYTNELWKGTKIAFTGTDEDALYVDLEPCEFQFKGDYSPFGCKLPVCGRVFNNRNAQSMSLVDLMKPHQIGYNVCMNQLYQLLEKEIGKFMIWDARFFNTMKDWGGEDSWDKVALLAKELGHVFGDTSPQNMPGGQGGQLPREINLELTAQMFSRAKLAEFFEARAMSQVGISQQLMADVKATETATGINTAVSQSQLNVQRYYSDFFEYKQRCLTMSLDIAQFVQSENRDITIMYTKSDASREFIKMTGIELLLRNMHVYVVNSQALLRQMEMIRQWYLTNNTSDVSGLDVLEVIKTNSPALLKEKLQELYQKKQQIQDQQMQQQQQQIDQAGKIAQMKEDKLDARSHETNETKKEVAYIATFNRQPNNLSDSNNDGTADVLEYDKLSVQSNANSSRDQIQRDTNAIKREQNAASNNLKAKELNLKEKALKVKQKESKDKVRIAKVNKN